RRRQRGSSATRPRSSWSPGPRASPGTPARWRCAGAGRPGGAAGPMRRIERTDPPAGPRGCPFRTRVRSEAPCPSLTPRRPAMHHGAADVTTLPAYRRDVNTVFQSYALFPHLDVFENVAFGLRRKRVGGKDIGTRVSEMLRLVDLPGFERRKPGQLSGGQRQRVALA